MTKRRKNKARNGFGVDGFGVDGFGRDLPDLTENVIVLGKARSERQDQLRGSPMMAGVLQEIKAMRLVRWASGRCYIYS